MKNILFSNIDKVNGFTNQQEKYIKKYISNNKEICFIASIFDDIPNTDIYYNKILSLFNDIGITFKDSYLIDKRLDKDAMHKILTRVDYVFLMGGDPFKQMNSILDYDLNNLINKKHLVIGVSAGAMNQTRRIIYKDDFDGYTLRDYNGLNYFKYSIYPHFIFDNKEMYNEVKYLSTMEEVLLLPNESFVFIDNGSIHYVGKHFFIKNNKIREESYYE